MNKICALLLCLGLVGFALVASACSFDTDCQIGSKCLKQSGSIYGICAGGMSPGNGILKTVYCKSPEALKTTWYLSEKLPGVDIRCRSMP